MAASSQIEPAASAGYRAASLPPDAPDVIADRRQVEDFAKLVLTTLPNQCVAGVALPWSLGMAPPGALAPISSRGDLDLGSLDELLRDKTIIVIGCTFKYREEEAAAARVVEQLTRYQQTSDTKRCIIAAHLLTPGDDHYSRPNFEKLMQVHKAIIELGCDDVLLDPEMDPARLSCRILLAEQSWIVNQEQLEQLLAEEPPLPSPAEIAALEARRTKLLWEDIPRELMPKFKFVPPDFVESDRQIGKYTLVHRMETQHGVVWEGLDEEDRQVAVKITRKSDIFTPGEVEGIYREYRFLSGFTDHPNIVRAVDCFITKEMSYTIVEMVLGVNLALYLSRLPGARMQNDETAECFSQIVSAVDHCHKRDISHRSIALAHIIVQQKPDIEGVLPKLIDFRDAMITKKGMSSVTMCGRLPCISPEVLSGEAYNPKQADCWSVGVVLLEMAGGKGCFFKSVGILETAGRNVREDPNARATLSEQIKIYFQTPGNHALAMTCMGATQNDRTVQILESLLQNEETRAQMEWLLPAEEIEPPEDEQEAGH